jgi:hypothetical protein
MTDEKPKGQRGGAGRGQGRKPGIPNRATLERAIQAINQTDEAKRNGKKLAKEVLEEFMLLFTGMAATYQPLPPGTAPVPGREPNEAKFVEYAKLAVETAADLAKYQSPTFKAMAVTMSTPAIPGDGARTIGGNVIDMSDQTQVARVYREIMQGPIPPRKAISNETKPQKRPTKGK